MFEILEHTADIGFRAVANSLPELFATAAEALVATAMETDRIEAREPYHLCAEADSCDALLVNWLSDVLYHVDGRRLAIRTFHVHEFTPSRVVGQAWGEPRDPERHPGKLIVKGITYHQLKVEHSQSGWLCEVYLDI